MLCQKDCTLVTDHIETLNFQSDAGLGQTARLGLIVLQSDQTVEHEFRQLVTGDGVALYHSRIPCAMEVTPGTLRQMALDLPRAAELLPTSFGFDAIGYGCTSGATMIGEAQVDAMIRAVHPDAKITNPISAVKAALTALGLTRVALVTPYAPNVTSEMQDNLRRDGFAINAVASFNQSDDFKVARISAQSIHDAIVQIGAREDCDGVFVSCTSLRALGIISAAEVVIGKPVVSSNQALAWYLMRLAGLDNTPPRAGRLFDVA
jgi:maleate isomerase